MRAFHLVALLIYISTDAGSKEQGLFGLYHRDMCILWLYTAVFLNQWGHPVA
jgi:hypothetical protein